MGKTEGLLFLQHSCSVVVCGCVCVPSSSKNNIDTGIDIDNCCMIVVILRISQTDGYAGSVVFSNF